MPAATVPLDLPYGGLDEGRAYELQPPGTTPDALNVRPRDPQTGRLSISQRAGTAWVNSTTAASTRPVRAMLALPASDFTIDPNASAAFLANFDNGGGTTAVGVIDYSDETFTLYQGPALSLDSAYSAAATTEWGLLGVASPPAGVAEQWGFRAESTTAHTAVMGESSLAYGAEQDTGVRVYVNDTDGNLVSPVTEVLWPTISELGWDGVSPTYFIPDNVSDFAVDGDYLVLAVNGRVFTRSGSEPDPETDGWLREDSGLIFYKRDVNGLYDWEHTQSGSTRVIRHVTLSAGYCVLTGDNELGTFPVIKTLKKSGATWENPAVTVSDITLTTPPEGVKPRITEAGSTPLLYWVDWGDLANVYVRWLDLSSAPYIWRNPSAGATVAATHGSDVQRHFAIDPATGHFIVGEPAAGGGDGAFTVGRCTSFGGLGTTFTTYTTAGAPASNQALGSSVAIRGDLAAAADNATLAANRFVDIYLWGGASYASEQQIADPTGTSVSISPTPWGTGLCFTTSGGIAIASTQDAASDGSVYAYGRSVTAATEGPRINGSDAVDDNASHPDEDFELYGCFPDSVAAERPNTDAYILEAKVTTSATDPLPATAGGVGFVIGAVGADIPIGNDNSTILWFGKTSASDALATSIRVNGQGSVDNVANLDSDFGDWEPNKTYRVRALIYNDVVELQIDDGAGGPFVTVRKTDSKRTVGGTAYDQGTEIGFLVAGLSSSSALVSLDDFEIRGGRLVRSSAAGGGILYVTGRRGYLCNTSTGASTFLPGNNVFANTPEISMVLGPERSTIGGNAAYIMDGRSYKRYSLESGAISEWALDEGKGDLPRGQADSGQTCRYGAIFRNRLVLYGLIEFPDNWYMSRAGDWNDWNYLPTDRDGDEPVAGNNTGAGLLPEPLQCFAPISADYALMGGSTKLWVMRGDPALGGRIDALTSRTGILGPNAFTVDPQGIVYFLGNDGLYYITPPVSEPQRASHGRIEERLKNIDPSASLINMEWCAQQDGLIITIITSDISIVRSGQVEQDGVGAIAEVWFWSKKDNAFFLDNYDIPGDTSGVAGPTSTAILPRDGNGDECVLFGGWDGRIRGLARTRTSDAGVNGADRAIVSHCVLPPIMNSGQGMHRMTALRPKMSSTTDAAVISAAAQPTAELAQSASPNFTSSTLGAGFNQPIRRVVTGAAIGVKVSGSGSGNHWALESLHADLERIELPMRRGGV